MIAARFAEWASAHEGAWLTLSEDRPHRSQSQNAYYWLYLAVIERETGENADDLHEFFKRKLLPPRFIKAQGEEIKNRLG